MIKQKKKPQKKKKNPAEPGIKLPIVSFSWRPFWRLGEDDLDLYRLGQEELVQMLSHEDYNVDFDWDPPCWGCGWETKVLYFPFRRNFGKTTWWFGPGLGIGSTRYRTEGDYSAIYQYQNYWDETETWKVNQIYKLKSTYISFDANFLLRKPFLCKFPGKPKLYGYVGFDFNFGKITHDMKVESDFNYENFESYFYSETETRNEVVKDNTLGLRWGLGSDFKITDYLHLSVEFYGRHAKFDDWSGERTDNVTWNDNGVTGGFSETIKGKLWFFRGPDFNGSFTGLEVLEQKPNTDFRDVRQGEINYNHMGFMLSVNLRLTPLFKRFYK